MAKTELQEDLLNTNKSRKSIFQQWLIGRVLDSRLRGRGFEPHRRHCVVFLSKTDPSLVLVRSRKTPPYIADRLLMGCKESRLFSVPSNYVFDEIRTIIRFFL